MFKKRKCTCVLFTERMEWMRDSRRPVLEK
jgi:hypothetical protein